jgi:hydroxyacylglutathione hydrolase
MNPEKMILRQLELGPMANFVYIIGCKETREAAVVDPAWDIPEILRIADELQLKIRHLLVTHAHRDHINGLAELIEKAGAQAYINKEESGPLQDFARAATLSGGQPGNYVNNYQRVSDGDEIRVGNLTVRCLHTPGHTPGSQCFLVEDCLFTGDTLFVRECGRVDLPGSDPERMWWSLNHKLKLLADEISVFPGHNYADRPTSTIGEEKRNNPYMRCATVQQFMAE